MDQLIKVHLKMVKNQAMVFTNQNYKHIKAIIYKIKDMVKVHIKIQQLK
jgi:hypothetical protein